MAKSKRPRSQVTPLNKRNFKKGVIQSPLQRLNETTPISWSSWKDDHLPNMLWAAVCAGNLERRETLELFRSICHAGSSVLSGDKHATLGHSFLSTLTYEQFAEIFRALRMHDLACSALKVLAHIKSLPDRAHWAQFFATDSESVDYWPVALGIGSCLDHQSQEATDVRWSKIYFQLASDRIRAPRDFIERIAYYPDKGDMRLVRPSIRAFEMAFRGVETSEDRPKHIPKPDSEAFWMEMMEETECVRPKRPDFQHRDPKATRQSLMDTLEALCDHFMESISTTAVDPRLDGAFGLAMNMLTLATEVSISPSNNFSTGRIILRTIVENFITLKYLSYKDDKSIWLQYRNYGSGQTSLAFIKNVFAAEVPDSIDMERLEMLANEDAWHETKDIVVGNWASLDLRRMATEAGIKDLYDAYYDWTSGFVHGNWGAVRDSSFTVCMNPLHRLHRIPAPGNPMPTVLSDCCKICNRALDEINMLYPSFKPRINWKSDFDPGKEA